MTTSDRWCASCRKSVPADFARCCNANCSLARPPYRVDELTRRTSVTIPDSDAEFEILFSSLVESTLVSIAPSPPLLNPPKRDDEGTLRRRILEQVPNAAALAYRSSRQSALDFLLSTSANGWPTTVVAEPMQSEAHAALKLLLDNPSLHETKELLAAFQSCCATQIRVVQTLAAQRVGAVLGLPQALSAMVEAIKFQAAEVAAAAAATRHSLPVDEHLINATIVTLCVPANRLPLPDVSADARTSAPPAPALVTSSPAAQTPPCDFCAATNHPSAGHVCSVCKAVGQHRALVCPHFRGNLMASVRHARHAAPTQQPAGTHTTTPGMAPVAVRSGDASAVPPTAAASVVSPFTPHQLRARPCCYCHRSTHRGDEHVCAPCGAVGLHSRDHCPSRSTACRLCGGLDHATEQHICNICHAVGQHRALQCPATGPTAVGLAHLTAGHFRAPQAGAGVGARGGVVVMQCLPRAASDAYVDRFVSVLRAGEDVAAHAFIRAYRDLLRDAVGAVAAQFAAQPEGTVPGAAGAANGDSVASSGRAAMPLVCPSAVIAFASEWLPNGVGSGGDMGDADDEKDDGASIDDDPDAPDAAAALSAAAAAALAAPHPSGPTKAVPAPLTADVPRHATPPPSDTRVLTKYSVLDDETLSRVALTKAEALALFVAALCP